MDEPKTTPSIGEYLRSEREKRNITAEQVASATKISLKLLHALEADDFDSLPAKPFVRGFVMAYAKYIGLNPQEVVVRFEHILTEKSGKKFNRPAEAPHIFVERDSPTENSKTLLSVVMGGFVLGAIVIFAFVKPSLHHHHHKKADGEQVSNENLVTVPLPDGVLPPAENAAASPAATPLEMLAAASPSPSPKATANALALATHKPSPSPTPKPTHKPSPSPSPKPTHSPKPSPTAKATPKATPAGAKPSPTPISTAIPRAEVKYMLVVRALDDSWIKYQADNFVLKQYTLHKGQKIYIRARDSIRFRCYKANGVELSSDGYTFKPLIDNSKTLIIPESKEDALRNNPFTE